MEKIKDLLKTEEHHFSSFSGADYIAEYRKAHPKASRIFDQQHAEKDFHGISKERINDSYEYVQGFSELVDPIVADMFVKIRELQAKSDDAQLSLPTWLGNRLVALGFSFLLHEGFREADEGYYDRVKLMGIEALPKEMKPFILKAAVTKILSDLVSSTCAAVAMDTLDDIRAPEDGFRLD